MDDLPDVADGAGAEGARGGRAAKRSNYMAVNHIEWKDVDAPAEWGARTMPLIHSLADFRQTARPGEEGSRRHVQARMTTYAPARVSAHLD